MKSGTKRVYIYPKDVERISGKKAGYCRRLLMLIRLVNAKKKYQGVTVSEYCDYMNISRDEIDDFL